MTTGEKIQYLRKRHGMTQKGLADLIGVHPVTIRKYEANMRVPQNHHAVKIARTFGVSPSVLLWEDPFECDDIWEWRDTLVHLLDSAAVFLSEDDMEDLCQTLHRHLTRRLTEKEYYTYSAWEYLHI